MATTEQKSGAATYRALFVSPEMTLSGAPIQLAHLTGWLKAHGWEPVVAAPEDGPVAEMFRRHGIELIFETQLLIDPEHAALRVLAARFDVVVANTLAGAPAVAAAHLESVPVIWYLHETLMGHAMEEVARLRPTLALADALVTSVRGNAEIYQPFTERPIRVVPYGIPELTSAPPTPGRPFTFLAVGAYEPCNGQDIFVEAIRELHPDVRWRALFQVAGRPLDKSFHEHLRARTESIYNVQLLGPLAHDRALELLNQADVVVCPSRNAAISVAALEAMSLGKALICTNASGLSEWLQDGSNALLVPPENPRALAEAIARCIWDRELVRALGIAAKQAFTEHFQLERCGKLFAEVLEQTIGHNDKAAAPGSYAEWVELYETLGPADRLALRAQIEKLSELPLISVLLPTYNPDLRLLQNAVDSVKRQLYDRWQLCIAEDASADSRVRPFLERCAAEEARIKLVFRDRKGGVAACSNSALALATGEWCVMLDQNDAMAEHALAHIVFEVAKNPEANLIYSDEDKIGPDGVRANPFFKPDWNPELFLAQNYLNNLSAYRTSLLRGTGGFRDEFDGAADYDLTLRYIERLASDHVRHIPRILYHRRTQAGIPTEMGEGDSHKHEAVRRAVTDHFERMRIAGRAESCPEHIASHRVKYDLSDPYPSVSIIIGIHDSGRYLRQCVESIRQRTQYSGYEIVIASNGSIDPEIASYLQTLHESGVIMSQTDHSRNLAGLNNLAATGAKADVFLLLHGDVEVIESDWLREMVSQVSRTGIGMVGARLWYPDGTLQHGGFVLGLGGIAGTAYRGLAGGQSGGCNSSFLQRNCSAVSWACMAVPAAVFRELGGFDEKNLTSNFQDIDFCLRAGENGLQVVWTPFANLVHHESTGAKNGESAEKKTILDRDTAYMHKRWEEQLREDIFYNPNFSLAEPGFELAFPPRWFAAEV